MCTSLKPDELAASAWSAAPGLKSRWTVANTEEKNIEELNPKAGTLLAMTE